MTTSNTGSADAIWSFNNNGLWPYGFNRRSNNKVVCCDEGATSERSEQHNIEKTK